MLEKVLDAIREQVDELNRLVDQVTRPKAPKEGLRDRQKRRLNVRILMMQDGVLPPRSVNRLGKWLKADPAARQYYVDFMDLSSMLHFHYHPEFPEKPLKALAGRKTE